VSLSPFFLPSSLFLLLLFLFSFFYLFPSIKWRHELPRRKRVMGREEREKEERVGERLGEKRGRGRGVIGEHK
jgi:hypothetical protein